MTLNQSLDGARATFNTVGPYDYFKYLDEITAFVGQIAFEEAVKITHRKRDGKNLAEIHVSMENELETRGVLYSEPSVQANIAHCTAKIYSGVLPEINVSPTEYALQDPT